MRNCCGAFKLSYFNLSLGNNRASNGRTEKVPTFINSIRAKSRKYIIRNELLAEVIYKGCEIAEGVIGAVNEVGVEVPVVVRLEGNNAELGREVLADSGLNIIAATSLTDAAQQVVSAAGVTA